MYKCYTYVRKYKALLLVCIHIDLGSYINISCIVGGTQSSKWSVKNCTSLGGGGFRMWHHLKEEELGSGSDLGAPHNGPNSLILFKKCSFSLTTAYEVA